jgi:hypothetical protein
VSAVPYALPIAMYRLTARLLLFLSLASVFAPAALAFSVAPQQTCCTRNCCRKMARHADESSVPSLESSSCCQRNCPCSLTVSQWADVAPSIVSNASLASSILQSGMSPLQRVKNREAAHSVRGPPVISIA